MRETRLKSSKWWPEAEEATIAPTSPVTPIGEEQLGNSLLYMSCRPLIVCWLAILHHDAIVVVGVPGATGVTGDVGGPGLRSSHWTPTP